MTFSNLELSYLEALTVGNKVVSLPRPDNNVSLQVSLSITNAGTYHKRIMIKRQHRTGTGISDRCKMDTTNCHTFRAFGLAPERLPALCPPRKTWQESWSRNRGKHT